MKEESNNHFKTHHVENIKELLSEAPDLTASACVIQIMSKEGRTGYLEEQGELIKNIWSAVTGSIPNIYGFRTSWAEIVFFHPSLELKSLQLEIIQILKSTLDAKLESKSVFSRLNGTFEERLKEIEKMGLQLSKVNYWEEHNYPSYWLNGEETKLKTTQP